MTLLAAIESHAQRRRERIQHERRVVRRLEDSAERLRRRERPTIDDVIATIEEIAMNDKYFTEEQREWLKKRREAVGMTGSGRSKPNGRSSLPQYARK